MKLCNAVRVEGWPNLSPWFSSIYQCRPRVFSLSLLLLGLVTEQIILVSCSEGILREVTAWFFLAQIVVVVTVVI